MTHALEDEVVVLTGGTSGIGRIAARKFAATGATVAIVGRNGTRGQQVVTDTASESGTVRFHQADLSTQSAVRNLATELREAYDSIDVLAHNAGLSVRNRTETEDGIEKTLAVNHLAPYLLTHELLEHLRASAPARVVVTASGIHRRATLDFDDLQFEQEYDSLQAYARSKLANIAFTIELADRLDDDITANCFHPGFVPATGLFRDAAPWTRLMMRVLAFLPGVGTTPQQGAERLVRLATDPEFEDRSGVYVGDAGIEQPVAEASNPEVRQQLWERSATLLGIESSWP
jgi:NAD(P)-dependent dehydrogenase (short-subunit alcohol dehydrogenase family)